MIERENSNMGIIFRATTIVCVVWGFLVGNRERKHLRRCVDIWGVCFIIYTMGKSVFYSLSFNVALKKKKRRNVIERDVQIQRIP